MIRIENDKTGNFHPRIYCDHSGERIVDAKEANADWLVKRLDLKPVSQVFHVLKKHDRACKFRMLEASPDCVSFWEGLDFHLSTLQKSINEKE